MVDFFNIVILHNNNASESVKEALVKTEPVTTSNDCLPCDNYSNNVVPGDYVENNHRSSHSSIGNKIIHPNHAYRRNATGINQEQH